MMAPVILRTRARVANRVRSWNSREVQSGPHVIPAMRFMIAHMYMLCTVHSFHPPPRRRLPLELRALRKSPCMSATEVC